MMALGITPTAVVKKVCMLNNKDDEGRCVMVHIKDTCIFVHLYGYNEGESSIFNQSESCDPKPFRMQGSRPMPTTRAAIMAVGSLNSVIGLVHCYLERE